jgi:uncharacterized protein YgiM (DUF1202 family)
MTKRIVALVAVLTLVMTMFILPTTASAIYTAYSNCSNGKPLNVRSGPGKQYPVIGTIPYREQVGVDHDLGNGWSELVWGSVPGYAMTSLMSRNDPGPYDPSRNRKSKQSSSDPYKNAKQVDPFWVTVRGTRGSGSVNLRWAPSTSAKLIRRVAYGSSLQVIAELGDWYQVTDPITGITGFAMKKFLPRE